VEGHILRDADEHVSGTVLHIRDVTESSLLEESMRRMERFSGLGPLVAGLHHEINNPLSALLLHVRLLEERLQGQADEEVSETLRIITTEVKRIAGVLRSFRDYAHLETLDCRATDLVGLARQTVELVRPQAEQQRVHIRVEAAENLPAVHADAARLGQVLLNLVLNALDEMPHGGSLIVQIQHSTDDEVALLVTDTGCGIPENIRPRIFDPYFTTKIDGSGMGLAFCDKIVREHGGRIDVTTNKTGTTFRVNLPLGSA
jgi:two-component system nitrogen regulation sensor histidine kinase GlnL